MRRNGPRLSATASRLTKGDQRRIIVLIEASTEAGRVLVGISCNLRRHIQAHKRLGLSDAEINDFEARFLVAVKGGVIQRYKDPILTARLAAWIAWNGSKEHLALVGKIAKAREMAGVNSPPLTKEEKRQAQPRFDYYDGEWWREQD